MSSMKTTESKSESKKVEVTIKLGEKFEYPIEPHKLRLSDFL